MQEATSQTILAAPNSRKILTWFLRIAGGSIAAIVTFLAFCIVINLKDAELNPAAGELLALSKKPVEMNNNGYIVLSAIDADESQDVLKIGQEVTEKLTFLAHENPSRIDYFEKVKYKKVPGFTWHSFRHDNEGCKDGIDFCIKADLSNRKVLETALVQNALLLKRYEMIQQLPQFSEPPTISPVLVTGNNISLWEGSDMAVTEAVFDIADGKIKEGIEKLQRNDLCLRRLMRQSSTLSSKTMITAMLKRQVKTISELMEMYPQLVNSNGDELGKMLTPLTSDELSLVPALTDEAQYSLIRIKSIKYAEANNFADHFFTLFYQVNATQNLMADRWKTLIPSLNILPPEFDRVRKGLQDPGTILNEHAYLPYLHYLYNPIGKILFYTGFTPYDIYFAYMENVADLDGYIRLVGLQLDIRRQGITDDKMLAYVNGAKEPFRSPYNHQPMTWDAAHKQLQFTGSRSYRDSSGTRNVYSVKML